MSNMEHEAIVAAGIAVEERVPIPDALVPPDARVEMDAKRAAGYFSNGDLPDPGELTNPKEPGLS